MSLKKKILVTVGTTQFQQLIQYTDSDEFIKILKDIEAENNQSNMQNNANQRRNFQVLSQIGSKYSFLLQRGLYIPQNSKYFRLSHQISQIYAESDYLICHGGAGTLLQNLHNAKKIIGVANDTLAGNHQTQLLLKLSKEGYLLAYKNVQDLKKNKQTIKDFFSDKISFKKYQKVNNCILNDIIFGQN